MIKPALAILFLSFCFAAQAQDMFVLKKKNKTLKTFSKYSYIAFQLQYKQWYNGYIEKIQHDSFSVKPMVIHYTMMGVDTVHYGLMKLAFTDIRALPKKGVEIGYTGEQARLTRSGGHVHWAWIKNGWLFWVGAAGYTALYLANGLVNNDLHFSLKKVAIASAVFSVGAVLHYKYKYILYMGKKYRLQKP